MPNPWDVGSAKLLAGAGFDALATTSAGLAWALGTDDQHVSRDELLEHVAALADATPLPLNVDAEYGFADDPEGVADTVGRLHAAGAAGCSIEDYDPAAGSIVPVEAAVDRVSAAAAAAHVTGDPLVLTARCEHHLYGVADLDATIARLVAYREAGADCLYAPGLVDLGAIGAVVAALGGAPLNVLALPHGPSVGELAEIGVRRVSTGSSLASTAYGALMRGARELRELGTSSYLDIRLEAADRRALA